MTAPDAGMDPQRLLAELRVHQAELEAQNEELRLARDEAQRALVDYTDLYELAPVGYATLREDATIIEGNHQLARLLGVDRLALRGRSLMMWLAEPDRMRLLSILTRVGGAGPTPAADFDLITAGGCHRTVAVTATRVATSGAVRMAFTDQTELRAAQRAAVAQRDAFSQQLKQTLEALDELVKLRTQELEAALNEVRQASAIKAEFLASMSHELRTPLNAVVGSVDTLREGLLGPLTDAQRRSLDAIELGAEHLLALIGDVLDMERIAADRLTVKRERMDVRALVERVRAGIEPLASTSALHFDVQLPSGALYIDGDALRLQQVLLNLLSNAVKFTPAGGSVTLRVLTGHVPGRVRRFEVEDTGIGIPEDQRARVFEPFAQVETGHTRRFGGTGLGLSISKALCDAMGLRLVIERSGPEGTVFAVVA